MEPGETSAKQPDDYSARIAAEQNTYNDCEEVHALPEIFHYWSNRHIRPMVEPFGFASPNGLFDRYLAAQCRIHRNRPCRFISIGSGNCDAEIAAAAALLQKGLSHFTLDCLDLNPMMLFIART